MSSSNYFCHACNQSVPLRDGDFVCARCGSEFIEEIEAPRRTHFVHPFSMLFETMMDGNSGSSSSQGTASAVSDSHGSGSVPTPPPAMRGGPQVFGGRGIRFAPGTPVVTGSGGPDDHIITLFLNQLLSNLSAQGAHIQLQITRDPHANVIHGHMGDYVWGEGGLDQIVTQLLNQFEGGATPVDPKLLGNLPMIVVESRHIDNDSQCTTCMEKFELDERVAELDCHHIFHPDCIIPWLNRHNTCPICRQAVDATKWPKCNPLEDLD